MDFGKAFTYFYEDENWLKKIGIGSVVMLLSAFLGIPAILFYGYELGIIRNVAKGKEKPLPDWDDWGGLFMDGLMITVAHLVYALPIILLVCIGMSAFILPAMAGGNEDAAAALAGVSTLIYMFFLCLAMLLGLAVGLLGPAIKIQYLRHGSLGACLRFGEVFGIARENMGDMVMYMLGILGAGLIFAILLPLSIITICGPIILYLAGPVWQITVSGHLTGQIARKIDGKEAAYA